MICIGEYGDFSSGVSLGETPKDISTYYHRHYDAPEYVELDEEKVDKAKRLLVLLRANDESRLDFNAQKEINNLIVDVLPYLWRQYYRKMLFYSYKQQLIEMFTKIDELFTLLLTVITLFLITILAIFFRLRWVWMILFLIYLLMK